jgi:DNA-binding MarR family transcriptional regulator
VENVEDIRWQFQQIIRHFGLLDKNCCSAGGTEISLVQSHILYEIDCQHEPSMQEIAETLGIDITTFSRQIQTLIQKKLVKKLPCSHDKRVSILSLTEEGAKVVSTIEKRVNEYLDEIFAHMNEFEKETVIRSLKLLNENMEKVWKRVCASSKEKL